MGEYTSAATFDGNLYVQKEAGSSIYEISTWNPTVFTFDIEPDSLELINIELVSLGNIIPKVVYYDGSLNSVLSHIGTSKVQPYLRVEQSSYWPGVKEAGSVVVATYGYSVGYSTVDNGVLLGAYYNQDFDRVWVIVQSPDTDSAPIAHILDNTFDPYYTRAYNFILERFYSTAQLGAKLVRESPNSSEFSNGQSSQLIYKLKKDTITITDANISINALGIGSSPGWVFDGTVSPPTLTLTSSKYRFNVKASCEYKGITYELLDTFYPAGYSPYGLGGNSGQGGGGGTFNPGVSDDVSKDVPIGTDIGNDSSTGMYTRYLMNAQYMKLFGDWMWDPDAGLSLIKTLYESWYGEKQSDSLISLLSFPFALTAPLTGILSQSQPLVLGHQNIIANYIALKSGGAQIDWGTLNLQEYWGNFLDYSPHTKIELYLPWGTGFVDIDPGQCLPGTLKVVTNIEFARGSCTHNVINQDGCVLGTYMGQPGSMVPMIASDIASKRAGMLVGAIAAGVGGVVAGGAAAVSAIGQSASVAAYTQSMSRLPMTMPASSRSAIATGIASQPLNVANEISSNLMPGATLAKHIASDAAIASRRHPAHMTRNGGFGDASAGTMIQYPYVIISRPEQNVPGSYGHHYGYPSNIYEPLANLRGYTEIAAIHLNGIGCTASEMSELESILAGGVIF